MTTSQYEWWCQYEWATWRSVSFCSYLWVFFPFQFSMVRIPVLRFTVSKALWKLSFVSLSFWVLSYNLDYFCTKTKSHIVPLISTEAERNQLIWFPNSIDLAADLKQNELALEWQQINLPVAPFLSNSKLARSSDSSTKAWVCNQLQAPTLPFG